MPDLQERLQAALGSAYRVEKELGGGGMSRVFLAEETALGRRVVVKVLPPEMAAGVNIERFRREIQLAASLQHPHIVPLHAAGQAGDLFYYTMPLVEGESLRVKLAREGELPIPEAVRIMRDVADALAHAHTHGVVHRDIKPDNVLITGHHAVVTDFGVAKAVSEATGQSSLTSIGVALGTPAYMAPEQASADPHTDHRADIYALGALAYEMLTGRPPFNASSPQMVLAAQVTQPPEPVTQQRPTVPPALAALIMRCLEKKPADRWQSAEELRVQLDAMATPSGGMTPTGAAPVAAAPIVSPPQRRPTRIRLYATLAAVVALLVVAGALALPRLRPPAEPAGGRPMVVVLPFRNLGSVADQYFADGVTEEITARLAALGGLGVISRTSASQYKDTDKPLRQIGRELGVQYVLEGTIRWERRPDGTSRVRVSPQLIKVADDTHLWAETYDEDLNEVFRVQSEIAERVAQALNVALLATDSAALSAGPTRNLQAYDAYLRGRAYFRDSTAANAHDRAIDLYQRAIALDSTFAAAYAALSIAHSSEYWFYLDRSSERLARARAAANRALALAPDLGDAHIALGYYHYWGGRDYAQALEQFTIALKTQPNNSDVYSAMAYVERRQGRWDQCLADLERAVALDPRVAQTLSDVGGTLLFLRRFDEAERYFDRLSALAPDRAEAYVWKALIPILRDGDLGTARGILREAATRFDLVGRYWDVYGNVGVFLGLDPVADSVVEHLAPPPPAQLPGYYLTKALRYRLSARARPATAFYDSARIVLEARVRERPEDYGFHASLGTAYAGLGRKTDAIREGERAVALLPVTTDAFAGPILIANLADILVTVGEYDSAIDRLEYLLSIPSYTTRHWLRLSPIYAPLVRLPRFQRLIAGD